MIDFTLTDEQRELQQTVHEFGQNVVKPLAQEAYEKSDPEEAFQTIKPAYEQAAEVGLPFAHIPEEYGGQGVSHVDLVIAAEELGAADIGFGGTLLVNGLAQLPIILYGSDEQKEKWLTEPLEAIDNGQTDYMCGYVVSEPAGEPGGTANFDHPGEYPVGMGLTAEYDASAGEYVLNGRKYWPASPGGWDLNGADQSLFVVRTDKGAGGRSGLSGLIVPSGVEGIEYNYIDKLGQRTIQNIEISCDDARIPEENLLAEGMGDFIANKVFGWSGPLVGAAAVGCAKAAYEYVLEWAKTYTGGGADPIFNHQAVGYLLYDVHTKLETSRYLCWKAAHYIDEHGLNAGALLAGSMAKVYATETCHEAIYDCMKAMGINSVDTHHPLNKLFRDIAITPLYDGGNIGMQRRKGWGIMSDSEYDPDVLRDNKQLEFTKDMEGWGTEGDHPPDI